MSSIANDTSWMSEDPAQVKEMASFIGEASGQWTVLYRTSDHKPTMPSTVRYCVLSDPARRGERMMDSQWEASIGSSGSGFLTYWEDGNRCDKYIRAGDNDDGWEPLVHILRLEGPHQTLPQLAEDFRLLFQLFPRGEGKLYFYDDSANEVLAAEINMQEVRVLTRLIWRYLAARQLDLLLFHESDVFNLSLSVQDPIWQDYSEEGCFEYWRTMIGVSYGVISRLRGKRLLLAPPREECSIPPFDEPKEQLEFIIQTDERGKPVRHSCDPELLANDFGKNEDAPPFLTLVFFRKEVLDKYYADPDRYSIIDGYILCKGSWSLPIDNDGPNQIIVFLGDLGRSLPTEEQRYWSSFNVPPQGSMSITGIQRAFFGQFADPTSADLRFRTTFIEINETWDELFGWPLFKPLRQDDAHVLTKLHIPLRDSAAEFDEQLTYLAKLLVDSLNEAEIGKVLRTKIKDEKGLGKFERYLTLLDFDGADNLLEVLHALYGLRSRGAAHRKGEDFDIKRAIGERDRPSGFRYMLERVTASLAELETHVRTGVK